MSVVHIKSNFRGGTSGGGRLFSFSFGHGLSRLNMLSKILRKFLLEIVKFSFQVSDSQVNLVYGIGALKIIVLLLVETSW
jgi:hypothetical protein